MEIVVGIGDSMYLLYNAIKLIYKYSKRLNPQFDHHAAFNGGF
jgi:hypothetical protein